MWNANFIALERGMEGEQGRKHVVLFLSSVCSILELQCAICVLLKTFSGLVLGLFRLCLGFVCSWFGIHIWRAIFFFRDRFCFFLVPGSMLSCFSDFLLFSFSAFLLLCFSAFLLILLLCLSCFSAFLLFAFPASLLFLLLCFSAFCFSYFFAFLLLCFPCLLYFCAFLLLLFYLFISSVMCFCCSTSCPFASLLPVFTVSLLFIFFCFILFCLYPKWNPRETLGETQRNPKEILIINPTWNPTVNEP